MSSFCTTKPNFAHQLLFTVKKEQQIQQINGKWLGHYNNLSYLNLPCHNYELLTINQQLQFDTDNISFSLVSNKANEKYLNELYFNYDFISLISNNSCNDFLTLSQVNNLISDNKNNLLLFKLSKLKLLNKNDSCKYNQMKHYYKLLLDFSQYSMYFINNNKGTAGFILLDSYYLLLNQLHKFGAPVFDLLKLCLFT